MESLLRGGRLVILCMSAVVMEVLGVLEIVLLRSKSLLHNFVLSYMSIRFVVSYL